MGAFVDFFRALAGRCDTDPLDPSLWSFSDNKAVIEVGQVNELNEMGSAVYLKGQGLPMNLLVVNTGPQGYRAYENRCTHMGRKLDPRDDGGTLRCCSVNHSTFDADGNKASGPAKGPIKTFPAQVQDGRLVISLG